MANNTVHRQIYELYIEAPPERVWDAITKAEFTQQYFFDGRVKSDWRAGSAIEYPDGDGDLMLKGEVLEIDPPRKLVQTFISVWDAEKHPDPPSKVTWQIEPAGGGSKLRLEHEHFMGESELAKSTQRGWPFVLSGLKTLLETGRPMRAEFHSEEAAAR